jgi:membrane protein required for colicin V production
LSKIDIVLAIFFAFGAFSGYRKGFLTELFSLLGIFLGVLAGFKLMGQAMVLLAEHYSIDDKFSPYVAFGVVFLIVVIVVSLIGKVLKTSLDKTVLGSADQIMGSLLGIARTAFMLSVLLWLIDSLSIEFPEGWTTDSLLYPITAKIAPTVTSWVSEMFPYFRDLFTEAQ